MTASDDFWQRVLATARNLDSYNYYQLFGVERTATAEQISDAFYRFARAIHPDKHAFEPDPERQRALVQVYARLHEGYRVLADQQHRAEYDLKLSGGKKRHAAAAAQIEEKVLHKADPATAQGRQALERSVAYFEEGDLPKARAQMQLAKQLEPNSKVIDKAFAEIMKADRRAYPRYDLDQRVEVQCASWEQPAVVYIKDISRSGMFLKSKAPPKEGSEFELKLCLPRAGSVFVRAMVKYRIGPKAAARKKFTAGFGLEFIGVNDETWAKIEEILPHYREASRAKRASQAPPAQMSHSVPLGKPKPAPPMATETGKQVVLRPEHLQPAAERTADGQRADTTVDPPAAQPAPPATAAVDAPADQPRPPATAAEAETKSQADKGHSRVKVKIPKGLLRQSGRHPRAAESRKIKLAAAGSSSSVRGTSPGTGPAQRPAVRPGSDPPSPGSNPPSGGSNPPAPEPAAAAPAARPEPSIALPEPPAAPPEPSIALPEPPAAPPPHSAPAPSGDANITFTSGGPSSKPAPRPTPATATPTATPKPAPPEPLRPRNPASSQPPADSEPLSADYLFGDDD